MHRCSSEPKPKPRYSQQYQKMAQFGNRSKTDNLRTMYIIQSYTNGSKGAQLKQCVFGLVRGIHSRRERRRHERTNNVDGVCKICAGCMCGGGLAILTGGNNMCYQVCGTRYGVNAVRNRNQNLGIITTQHKGQERHNVETAPKARNTLRHNCIQNTVSRMHS